MCLFCRTPRFSSPGEIAVFWECSRPKTMSPTACFSVLEKGEPLYFKIYCFYSVKKH